MGRVTAIRLVSTKTRVFFLRGFTSCYLAGLSRFESGQLMARTSWDSLLLTSIRAHYERRDKSHGAVAVRESA